MRRVGRATQRTLSPHRHTEWSCQNTQLANCRTPQGQSERWKWNYRTILATLAAIHRPTGTGQPLGQESGTSWGYHDDSYTSYMSVLLCSTYKGGVGAYFSAVFTAVLAPMTHLWNYLLGFHLQLCKTIAWYTTAEKPSGILLGVLNLPRCQLHQSRFTVFFPAAASNNSDLAAANHSPAMYVNRERGR